VGTISGGVVTNGVDISPTGIILTGTARPTKRITLAPEYPGATMTAGSGSGANAGSMSSDFCSGAGRKSVNASVCALPSTSEEHNFYKWLSATGTNDYDIYVRYQLPSDFDVWASNSPIYMYGFRTGTTDKVELTMYNSSNGQCGSGATTTGTVIGTTNANWTETALDASLLSDSDCTTMTAGSVVTFRIRMTSTGASNPVYAGELRLDYLAKF
jgi:hypothetical protein